MAAFPLGATWRTRIVSERWPSAPSVTVPSARESEPTSRYVVPGVPAAPESAGVWTILPFAQKKRPIGHARSRASRITTTGRRRRRRPGARRGRDCGGSSWWGSGRTSGREAGRTAGAGRSWAERPWTGRYVPGTSSAGCDGLWTGGFVASGPAEPGLSGITRVPPTGSGAPTRRAPVAGGRELLRCGANWGGSVSSGVTMRSPWYTGGGHPPGPEAVQSTGWPSRPAPRSWAPGTPRAPPSQRQPPPRDPPARW